MTKTPKKLLRRFFHLCLYQRNQLLSKGRQHFVKVYIPLRVELTALKLVNWLIAMPIFKRCSLFCFFIAELDPRMLFDRPSVFKACSIEEKIPLGQVFMSDPYKLLWVGKLNSGNNFKLCPPIVLAVLASQSLSQRVYLIIYIVLVHLISQ